MLPGVNVLIPSLTSKITGGISGLIGDTATDKRRVADADALLQRALAGDDAALIALCYEAFERRNGLPGDPRTPIDGKESPQVVQDLAVKRLQRYVAARGGLPPAASQWATKLDTAVLGTRQSLTDTLVGAVQEGIAQGTERATTDRVQAAASRAVPYVGIAVVVGLLGMAFYVARASK